MLYLQRKPAPPLDEFVQLLWYASAPEAMPGRQRILPTGSSQIILDLSREHLLDFSGGPRSRPAPPAQVVGARSAYEIIDNSDLACLIGLAFRPGGFGAVMGLPADLFANRFVNLEDVWGAEARKLRDALREIHTPQGRFAHLELFLCRELGKHSSLSRLTRHPAVAFGLDHFRRVPSAALVSQVARSTGWSERRFSQLFREQVGLTPKVWCRIQRFQSAVRRLYAGDDVRWGELALDCGYYDQSHFANEFRAFSGIDISTYSAAGRTPWANHIVES